MKIKHKIVEPQAGQRVDLILAGLCPGRSLREVRRSWGTLQVTLNSRPIAKGVFVNEGDCLEADLSPIFAAEEVAMNNAPEKDIGAVKVLQRKNGVVAMYKPAGLHSARLPGGRGGLSLEELLPSVLVVSGLASGQILNQNSDRGFAPACAQDFNHTEGVAVAKGHEQDGHGANCLPAANLPQAGLALFNRLDCLTSGLVLATENQAAFERCLRFEESGQIEKRYFALVHGVLPGEIVMRQALDTDSRGTTRVLKKDDPNPLRRTVARPLLHFASLSEFQAGGKTKEELNTTLGPHLPQSPLPGEAGTVINSQSALVQCLGGQHALQEKSGFSLLEVVIYLGARHQIRAHLSFAGYPIVGDPVYGPRQSSSAHNLDSQCLYLHHFGLTMPGFVALCQAPWGQKARKILAGFYPALQNWA